MEKQQIIANRYKIIDLIGEGGTAKVYLAYDMIQEFDVSLKILKPDLVTEQKIRHFRREAQAISLLDDEHIIKIYEIGEDENELHYIAQEYVEGMTLKDYLKISSKIQISEVLDITKQILVGLDHAHEQGVIHKDIKGQNILINSNKKIKITDFGIADIIADDVTRTQSLMGTPQYVSPETLNRGNVNKQTDIYSVGILMFELLTGTAPFTGEKPAVIMLKQLNQPLPSIRMARTDVPQFLENIVIKATAKRLDNRYKCCADMINDIDNLYKEENVNAKKLEFVNDLFENEELEKTINFTENITYSKLKEQDNSKSKNQKKMIILGVLGLLVILIGSLTFIQLSKEEVVMPDLVNMTEESARQSLVAIEIDEKNITIKKEPHEKIEKDKIISTTPSAEDVIKNPKEQKITIVVSTGPPTSNATDFSGQLITTVQAQLEKDGYIVKVSSVESSEAEGTILSQTPEAGSTVKKGDTFEFEVSNGISFIDVPNFIGLDWTVAQKFGQENQISIKKTDKCFDTVGKDKIFEQNPTYGSTVSKGDSITISVSTGKCPVTPPPTPPTDNNGGTGGSTQPPGGGSSTGTPPNGTN
ncbi:MAG: Stk1 family PASTA domain-containing Ser/Thr kinase [Mycoplasmatales bacterium]